MKYKINVIVGLDPKKLVTALAEAMANREGLVITEMKVEHE